MYQQTPPVLETPAIPWDVNPTLGLPEYGLLSPSLTHTGRVAK
jgi:hypothetical protein